MKKIGLFGGMSWESTQEYYRILNESVKEKLGGFHSCRLVLESLNFAEIEIKQRENDWDSLQEQMVSAAINLEKAGAELLLLATNKMHLCAGEIKKHVKLPFLHIAEATGRAIQKDGVEKVVLLGTRFTMEGGLYTELLKKQFQIEVLLPAEEDRILIHDIIYKELVHGLIKEDSRRRFQDIIETFQHQGAQGVILGCTEIPLLIQAQHAAIKVYDTTAIHCVAAVDSALTTD